MQIILLKKHRIFNLFKDIFTVVWDGKRAYVNQRKNGFKGLFPGKIALVETSVLAGMLIKYEEDFILCSKIEEAMNFD